MITEQEKKSAKHLADFVVEGFINNLLFGINPTFNDAHIKHHLDKMRGVTKLCRKQSVCLHQSTGVMVLVNHYSDDSVGFEIGITPEIHFSEEETFVYMDKFRTITDQLLVMETHTGREL